MNAILLFLCLQAPVPVHPPSQGSWISDAELAVLPMSGPAWQALLSDANGSLVADLGDQNERNDSHVFAAALVYRRLLVAGDATAPSWRQRVEDAMLLSIGSEAPGDGSSLPPSRNVCSFALAADLIDCQDQSFKDWARFVLTERYNDGRSIVSTHESRPNNWGTHAGASRAALACYLDDAAELARCAQVFKGWCGDRASYAGFQFGNLSWQSDPLHPVAINPLGAQLLGAPVDGALPEEQRRCEEPLTFPAAAIAWMSDPSHDGVCQVNYVWEAMQGAVVQAIILHRAGYDSWRWGQFALGRAAWWSTRWNEQPPDAQINGSDDRWQAYVLRRVYPRLTASIQLVAPAPHGKHVGYTDWTTLAPSWP